jgi:23S rRNA pseudouridine955/2504/2580 synthase
MHYPLCIALLSLTISSPSDADQRIDKFIRKYLPNAPLGGIFKWLRTGKIKVNGRKVDQNDRIQEGDVIELYFEEKEIEEMRGTLPLLGGVGGGTPPNLPYQGRNLELSILYEDDTLLVVNKPA